MKTIPLKPERQAELEEFAHRRGKTPADALDEALATYLEWEKQDFEDAVRGIQQGYDDVKAARFGFSFRRRASSVDRSYLVDKSFLLYPSICGLNSLKCIGERYSGMKRQIPTDGGQLIGIEWAF